MTPRLFIGSSTEGLEPARAFAAPLASHFDVVMWDNGVFKAGNYFMDDLVAAAREADVALFVATPDDVLSRRGRELLSPRDNVLLEYGLFAAILGRRRTCLAVGTRGEVALPSDVGGITQARFTWATAPTAEDWASINEAAMKLDRDFSEAWTAYRDFETELRRAVHEASASQACRKLHTLAVHVRELIVVLPGQMAEALAKREDFERVKRDAAARLRNLRDELNSDAELVGVGPEFRRLMDAAERSVKRIPFPDRVPTNQGSALKMGLAMAEKAWDAVLSSPGDRLRAAQEAAEKEAVDRIADSVEDYAKWWKATRADLEAETGRLVAALVDTAFASPRVIYLPGPSEFGLHLR